MAKIKITLNNSNYEKFLQKFHENSQNDFAEKKINEILENYLNKDENNLEIDKFINQYINFIKNNNNSEIFEEKIKNLKNILKDLYKKELENMDF